MGIRKSSGKNKKSNRRATRVAVRSGETRRRATADLRKSRPQGMR